MSKLRKLQQEVDLTLRKINEGVQDWLKLWDKLHITKDESKCEKYVEMLKRDLKKLQRQREQVRAWATSGEFKEIGHLMEARRSVEELMETFHRWEKDNKVKAFSTIGLSREDQDPATKAKIRCADWLRDAANRLETQTETLDADVEALGTATTKAGKASKDKQRATLLQHINKHQDYISKVERVLRLLLNDQVTPDEVEYALKDSLEYYIDAFAEDDYMEDEEMWSMLPLDVVDEGIGKISSHKGVSSSALSLEEQSGKEDEDEEEESEVGGSGSEYDVMRQGEERRADESSVSLQKKESPSPILASVTPAQPTKEREKIMHPTPSDDSSTSTTMTTTPLSVSSMGRKKSGDSTDVGDIGVSAWHRGDTTKKESTTDQAKASSSPRSPSAATKKSSAVPSSPPPPPPPRPSPALPSITTTTETPLTSLSSQISSTPSPQYRNAVTPVSSSMVGKESSIDDDGKRKEEKDFLGSGFIEIQGEESTSDLMYNNTITTATITTSMSPPTITTTTPTAATTSTLGSNGLFGTDTDNWPQWHLGTWIKEAEEENSSIPIIHNHDHQYDGSHGSNGSSGEQQPVSDEHGDTMDFLGRKEESSPFGKGVRWEASRLDILASNIPSLDDAEWHLDQNTIMCPRGTWSPSHPATTPLSYPNQIHPTLYQQNTFNRLSTETAFLAFYYQQHCIQQSFAIDMLKSQGWRYHTHYKTWFARYGAPIEQYVEYEKGSLKFWDATMDSSGGGSDNSGFGSGTSMDGSGSGGGVIGGGNSGGGRMGWCVRRTPPNFIFEYSKMAP